MPMPVELDGEWIPLQRYSNFEFGARVDRYISGAPALLFRNELPSKLGFSTDVRARYRSEDLDCFVETVNGVVHRITAFETCLFRGLNIVGSKIGAVLNLLGVIDVSRHVPAPEDPLEWIGVIPDLGLEFQVMCHTQTIVEVRLRPSLLEYVQRERLAQRHLGGLIDALRPREAQDFVHPIYQAS